MSATINNGNRLWSSISNPFADPVQDLEGGISLENLPCSSRSTIHNGDAATADENPITRKIQDGLYVFSVTI